jgi:hypothetical protein
VVKVPIQMLKLSRFAFLSERIGQIQFLHLHALCACAGLISGIK